MLTLEKVLRTTDTSAGMNTPECIFSHENHKGTLNELWSCSGTSGAYMDIATTETAELMNTQATLGQMLQTADTRNAILSHANHMGTLSELGSLWDSPRHVQKLQ